MNTSILRISDFQNIVRKIITPETEGRKLQPDIGFVSDKHPFFEVIIVLKGTCDYPLDDRLYTLTPGTAVLIPPWCRHSYGYRTCDMNLLHLWLHFQTSCRCSGVRVRHGNMTVCPEFAFSVSPELHTLFLNRWDAWKQTKEKKNENLFFQNVLNLFLEERLLHEGNPRERNIVSETIALIRNSNGRGCTLDYLAKQARCSKYHLAHRVQQSTGKTIGDYIKEARLVYIDSAKKQGMTQKEIAWNLGFSSAVSFWNWYHKRKS